jgi:hypothetical protein
MTGVQDLCGALKAQGARKHMGKACRLCQDGAYQGIGKQAHRAFFADHLRALAAQEVDAHLGLDRAHPPRCSAAAVEAVQFGGRSRARIKLVRSYVESCGDKFVLETLPPYAPELNPVEYIWGYMKQRELANLCLETIGQVGAYARNRLKSMQRRLRILAACWAQAELPI